MVEKLAVNMEHLTPVGGSYFDRCDRDKQEAALQAVRDQFDITVGNATVYQLNNEQLTVLARVLFDNPSISYARQKTEKGTDGFTYSYVEGFVDKSDKQEE